MTAKILELDKLKGYLGSRNPSRTKQCIEDVRDFFDNELSTRELEFALQKLFDYEIGTLSFLRGSIKDHNKAFKESNVILLTLYKKLLEQYGKQLDLSDYADSISQCCMEIILSMNTSAKEKERAINIMQQLILNDLKLANITEILQEVLQIFYIKLKIPGTVAKELYILLGVIAKCVPEEIGNENSVAIRGVFFKGIEIVTMDAEDIHFIALSGALEGLNMFLYNFAPSPETDTRLCQELYMIVKKLSDPLDFKKREPFRIAVDIFTYHSLLFCEKIFNDLQFWFDCLNKWLKMPTVDDRRRGIEALNTFFRVMGEQLMIDIEFTETKQRITHRFTLYFKQILESPNSEAYESRVAIRGFGLMAGPCKNFLPAMLNQLTLLVIQRTELISATEPKELRNILEHFHDYILALSQIIVQTQEIQARQILLRNLQNIMISLIKYFYFLSPYRTSQIVRSLSCAFLNFFQIDATMLDDLLSKIIFQGVVWACQHKLVFEAKQGWEQGMDWKENITYKNFLPLWRGFLTIPNSSADQKIISKKIFDQLMTTLFLITSTLNLRTQPRLFADANGKTQELYFCDPNIDLKPVNEHDFHIFFNIIDFYRDILKSNFDKEYFRLWIVEYCRKMINLAIENPLISGFLKLLDVGLSLANNLDYFKNQNNPQTYNFYLQIKSFLKAIIVKCQRSSNELQISYLELILNYPVVFYEEFIIDLIPVFQIALNLGQSSIDLARLAINGLENIADYFFGSTNDLKIFYKQVLPLLDCYLQSQKGDIEVQIVRTKNNKRRAVKKSTRLNNDELMSIQKRIALFLGKLDPHHAAFIISENYKKDLVKWDANQHLRMMLVVPEITLNIYLDSSLPRICELALTSQDRPTKIAACELLHGIILFILGTRKHKTEVWKELSYKMLLLGADGDETVQEIFKPLLKQIMHFMSKHENLHEGAEYLIESLMRGISSYENCMLRDLAAINLRELVDWSIKQKASDAQLAASPLSIEKILYQLSLYCLDSSQSKRNSAAIAFNNLYTIIREEEFLCDVFFVDLLYTFCSSYKLTEEFSTVTLTAKNSDLDQISKSLNHVVRVLKERNSLYHQRSNRRKLPNTFEIGTLSEVVQFLLNECGTKLMNYRHKCREMFETLAVKLTNITTIHRYFTDHGNQQLLRKICEGDFNDETGIAAFPDLSHLKSTPNLAITGIYNWLEYVFQALDNYCWLLSSNCHPNPISLFEQTNIFKVISYFLTNICWKRPYDICLSIGIDSMNDTTESIMQFNAEEMVKISNIKSIIIIRIVEFLIRSLKRECKSQYPTDFFDDNKPALIKLASQLILEPRELGIDSKSDEISKNLPDHLKELLKTTHKYLSDKDFNRELQVTILEKLVDRLTSIKESTTDLFTCRTTQSTQPYEKNLTGLAFFFANIKLLNPPNEVIDFYKRSSRSIFSQLFMGLKQNCLGDIVVIEVDATVRKVVNEIMEICLVISGDDAEFLKDLVDCLFNSNSLKMTSMRGTVTHGDHFYNLYKTAIFQNFNESFTRRLLELIFNNLRIQNYHTVIRITIDSADFLYKFRNKTDLTLPIFVDMILLNVTKLKEVLTDINDGLLFIELLSNLAMISPFSYKTFKEKAPILEDWIISRLQERDVPQEYKSKILILLPLIVGPEDTEHLELTKALESLQSQYIPLESTKYRENSLEETALKSLLKGLLNAMAASQSTVMLSFIIKCASADEEHLLEDVIRAELKNFYTEQRNIDHQINCLCRVFEMCNSVSIEPKVRINIFHRFMETLILYSSERTLVKFFEQKINRISELIKTEYSFSSGGWDVEHALVNRIFGFSLIEKMFLGINRNELIGNTSTIANIYFGREQNGAEILAELSKIAFTVRKEVFVTTDTSATEFFRQYQCSAYRATCSIVSNTQTELRFYRTFILLESQTKNKLIWSKLIDCTNENLYLFGGQKTEDFKKKKSHFSSVRTLNLKDKKRFVPEHLETQNVFRSSLSQHMTNVDLHNSFVRTNIDASNSENAKDFSLSISMESNPINNHEVMPTLCAVIRKLFESNIIDVKGLTKDKPSFDFIVAFGDLMISNKTHKNIRLFLAQLIDNCKENFMPFAHLLFEPILEVLVDKCAGNQLNYFVTDLTTLLLSWTATEDFVPGVSAGQSMTKLLKFYMENAWNEDKEIYKLNLEIIQTMINLWKNHITTPSQLLYDLISRTQHIESRENEHAIILIAIFFSRDLPPWTTLTKRDFIWAIYHNLSSNIAPIYKLASEVMGMMMKCLQSENGSELLEEVTNKLHDQIKSLKDKNEKKFLDILYGVQKSFPDIIDLFRQIISSKIPSAIGPIKRSYLEMYLVRIELFSGNQIYNELMSICIKDLLERSEYQTIALYIVNRAVSKMSLEEAEKILPSVEKCLESTKPENRDVAYEIIIFLAKNFNRDLKQKPGSLLLKGMSDPDLQIQNRIFEYWSKEADLPKKIHERLLSMIVDYSGNCEKQFLGFCAQLLLQSSIEMEESNRKIFEFESEDQLFEFSINTAARAKNSYTLPPLFAVTQQWGTYFGFEDLMRKSATKDLVFEPTQDPNKIMQNQRSFVVPTRSSLPFETSVKTIDRRLRNISQEDTRGTQLHGSLEHLRNQYRYVGKSQQSWKEKKKITSKVSLHRRYRYGDYPDLLITYRAILLPLQALVKKDHVIARQVFVKIFESIIVDGLSTDVSRGFLTSIGQEIQNIFEICKTCDPSVFATFLEVALLKPNEFNLNPETIALISKASNSLTIGALYLEYRINSDWSTDQSAPATTSTSRAQMIDEQHWLYLSEIFNELAEYDIVAAIFSDKIVSDPLLSDAIARMNNSDYEKAIRQLHELTKRQLGIERYYAHSAYLECCMQLGAWSKVSPFIGKFIHRYDELWLDDNNTKVYLPALMQAQLQLVMHGEEKNEDFLNDLQAWMQDPIKLEVIERNYCQELMMLYIGYQDFRQARVRSENYLNIFLNNWNLLTSLNNKLRTKVLLNAQIVAEIDQYSKVLSGSCNSSALRGIERKWSNCHIEDSDSLRYWNTIISYRSYVAEVMEMMHNSENTPLYEGLVDAKYKMNLEFFDAAAKQNNYILADQIANNLAPLKNHSDEHLSLKYELVEVKKTLMQAIRQRDRIKILETAWIHSTNILENEAIERNHGIKIEALDIHAQIGEALYENVMKTPPSDVLRDSLFHITRRSNSESLVQRIFDQTFWALQESTSISEAWLDETSTSILQTDHIMNSFYRLAQFCYDYHETETFENNVDIQKTLIKSVLQAMNCNSNEARQLFPYILEVLSNGNEELFNVFTENTTEITEWMFLAWIPQILSGLTFAESSFLDDILIRIAKVYPSALIYPFGIWLEKQENELTGIQTHRQGIKNICNLLEIPATKKFIESIKNLCLPNKLLLIYVRDLQWHVTNNDQSEFEKILNKLLHNVFTENSSIRGDLYRNISEFKTQFEEMKNLNFGENTALLKEQLITILNTLKEQPHDEKIDLEKICPWLASYQWCGDKNYLLELPGIYTGEQRPSTFEQIKIVKFHPTVVVLQSKQCPLRIRMHASDGKSYDYIIKFGEDLRRDQRVQQMLKLMSNKLTSSRNDSGFRLKIQTFIVVPIELKCGMLSWIENSEDMLNFLKLNLKQKIPNWETDLRLAMVKHKGFLQKRINPTDDPSNDFLLYGTAAASYSLEMLANSFKAISNQLGLHGLQTALFSISISPECYYVIRNNFISSLATMNICNWILGIGDRHLKNTLLNTKNGTLAGVDFEFAFGTGTRNLPIPEMIPFRLTPQFVNVINPMGTSGLIFKTMAYVLQQLKANKKILLACLEVFVRDPMLDWLARCQDDENASSVWEHKDRIDIVKCKLNGYNPMNLLERELQSGYIAKDPSFLDGYTKILRGNPQFNVRARLGESDLSTEDQVKCLIDMATDPAILGITFRGFLPWI